MRKSICSFLGSNLTGGQRGWHWLVGLTLTFLLANTLFLLARRYAFGCALDAYQNCSVSAFYQASVLLHSFLGLLLAVGVVIFLSLHVSGNIKTALSKPRLPVTGIAILLTLGVLLWSGLHFLFNAKTADTVWLYYSHLGMSALIVVCYFGHRMLARPVQQRSLLVGGIPAVLVPAMLMVATEVGVGSVSASLAETANSALRNFKADSYQPPSGVAVTHDFFPSPVSLASGAAAINAAQLLDLPVTADAAERVRAEVTTQGFASTELIGAEKCVRCHQDTVQQWASSAHRFSSFNNPFYVATVEYLRNTPVKPNEFISAHLAAKGLPTDATGKVKSKWCAGCHDPMLMLPATMQQAFDKGSVAAQAGLTCLSCHLIESIPDHTGNGNYVWNDRYRNSYIFAQANTGPGRALHDMYLKANPERHIADLIKPFYKNSEYCATCHKVSLDRPVNDYRWLRGQDEYDNWHNSGVAHNAGRTFYLPQTVNRCQDCHMPLVDAPLGDLAATDGKIRSHRFLAANTALPWLRDDRKMLEQTERFLQDKRIRLFVGGVAGADGVPVSLADGEAHAVEIDNGHLQIQVVVRNLRVGHTFPGGTNDSNQAWIELSAPGGNYKAGVIGDDGKVPENTRIYHVLAVDKNGRRIDKRNAHEMIAPVYVAVIPPGTADLSRYAVPLDSLGDLDSGTTLKVRLLWRKFDRPYTEFAFNNNRAGFPEFATVPDLPVTEIAAVALRLKRQDGRLLVQADNPAGVEAAALAHDYAIGFLRQGDLKSARRVTDELLARDPNCVNCLRTLARIQIREGQFIGARSTLGLAEVHAPGDPQTAWLWAKVLVQEGNYAAAAQAAARVLSAFPGDREAIKLAARVAYLDGRFEDSITAVKQALAIDSEDATAHYYAMLAYRALGDSVHERESEAAYRYHKADETAQQTTLAFRQGSDESNFASQTIKVFTIQ